MLPFPFTPPVECLPRQKLLEGTERICEIQLDGYVPELFAKPVNCRFLSERQDSEQSLPG